MRKNWEQIFTNVGDIHAVVLRRAADGDNIWSEWEMSGTRRDGSPHLMRGVVIFGVRDDRATWARFYLEPVVDDGADVNAAVRQTVAPGSDGAS